jgi:hypothetical protein
VGLGGGLVGLGGFVVMIGGGGVGYRGWMVVGHGSLLLGELSRPGEVALRGPGESYSDVILRLASVGHESLNGS